MDIQGLMWQEGWTPTTDTEVTQLLRLLGEKKKETDRIIQTAKDEITELEGIWKEVQDSYGKLEWKVNQLCQQYVLNEVDKDDRKETPTTIKYKIARGEIVINKESKSLVKPTTEKDIQALKELYPDMFKVEPVLQWAELKKNLEINQEGKVIDKKSGKVLESVPVVDVPQTVSIKLAKK
jgi:hypothetical protein